MDIVKTLFSTIHKKIDYSILQNECILTHLKALIIHQKNFKEYLQCNRGKNIALIATGPTLKYAYFLNDFIYVGVNGAYKQNFAKLNYIFIQDNAPILKEINNYLPGYCEKFYGIIPQQRCRDLNILAPISIFDIQDANAKAYYLEDMMYHNWPNDISVEPFRDNCGTVFSAMQFIFFTHPKNIYLFGCDCTNGKHFYDKDNFQHDFTYQLEHWKSLKDYAKKSYKDINIYSVNPVGLKNIFTNIYTKNFLDDHPEINRKDLAIL